MRRRPDRPIRLLGQPLRYLVYGFDFTILWLVFKTPSFANTLGEIMRECREWLGLLMVLLQTSPPRLVAVYVRVATSNIWFYLHIFATNIEQSSAKSSVELRENRTSGSLTFDKL